MISFRLSFNMFQGKHGLQDAVEQTIYSVRFTTKTYSVLQGPSESVLRDSKENQYNVQTVKAEGGVWHTSDCRPGASHST